MSNAKKQILKGLEFKKDKTQWLFFVLSMAIAFVFGLQGVMLLLVILEPMAIFVMILFIVSLVMPFYFIKEKSKSFKLKDLGDLCGLILFASLFGILPLFGLVDEFGDTFKSMFQAPSKHKDEIILTLFICFYVIDVFKKIWDLGLKKLCNKNAIKSAHHRQKRELVHLVIEDKMLALVLIACFVRMLFGLLLCGIVVLLLVEPFLPAIDYKILADVLQEIVQYIVFAIFLLPLKSKEKLNPFK